MSREHVVVGILCQAFQVPSTTASYNPSIRAVRRKHCKAYIIHPHAVSVLGLCESEDWEMTNGTYACFVTPSWRMRGVQGHGELVKGPMLRECCLARGMLHPCLHHERRSSAREEFLGGFCRCQRIVSAGVSFLGRRLCHGAGVS